MYVCTDKHEWTSMLHCFGGDQCEDDNGFVCNMCVYGCVYMRLDRYVVPL